MTQLQMAMHTLAELARRVRTGEQGHEEGDKGYQALLDVVDDVGRALVGDETDEVRELIPFVAASREALEDHYLDDGVHPTPAAALADPKVGAAYAAGALWVLSALSHAWLSEHAAREVAVAEKSGRTWAREAVMELVHKQDLVRPQDALEALRRSGLEVDKATVSRTLGDLLEARIIEPASPPAGSDRRCRWYRLTATTPSPPEAATRSARQAIGWLFSVSEHGSARQTVQDLVDEMA